MASIRRPMGAAATLVLIITAVACGGGGTANTSGNTVRVTLSDLRVQLSSVTMPAGTITFEASNDGPSTHEIEVLSVPAGVDANALPISANIADTQSLGLESVDEVENIAASTSASLTVDLSAGSYVVICNLPGHYTQGMSATFTVT
jgi:uncharacterized cupredoxin-like copper-binding protein